MPDAQPVDKIKNIIGVVSALVGQIPWALTMWSQYPVSLYQPAIYRGKGFFVVVPVMIGVVAVLALLRYRAAIWFVLTAFLIITAFVYWVAPWRSIKYLRTNVPSRPPNGARHVTSASIVSGPASTLTTW
jgi:hypothetical protein